MTVPKTAVITFNQHPIFQNTQQNDAGEEEEAGKEGEERKTNLAWY